jgi:hypothetical protein
MIAAGIAETIGAETAEMIDGNIESVESIADTERETTENGVIAEIDMTTILVQMRTATITAGTDEAKAREM